MHGICACVYVCVYRVYSGYRQKEVKSEEMDWVVSDLRLSFDSYITFHCTKFPS